MIWIARDNDGGLYIFNEEPYRTDDCGGIFCAPNGWYDQIDSDSYEDVTFENSPQKLIPHKRINNDDEA